MMHIAFRVDASLQIGTGHVMRCLTLANALRERGANCSFVCRTHQGHLLALIAQHGHHVLAMPDLNDYSEPVSNGAAHAHWLGTDWTTDAQDTQQALSAPTCGVPVDWLVVDHYALDTRWEKELSQHAKHIMVIDDLADRAHTCDVLLDQNLGRNPEDYCGLLQGKTTTLIGPRYALLRPEFAALRAHSLARRQGTLHLRNLLITMGGVDKDNATGQVLAALRSCNLPADLRVTVVMGPHAPWLAQVQAQAMQAPWPTEVLIGVNNMAQLMAESDLAIGAAGSTSWERCCLGLPCFMLVLAPNQMSGATALQRAGAAIAVETYQQLSDLLNNQLSAQPAHEMLTQLSHSAAAVTNGMGYQLVAEEMWRRVNA